MGDGSESVTGSSPVPRTDDEERRVARGVEQSLCGWSRRRASSHVRVRSARARQGGRLIERRPAGLEGSGHEGGERGVDHLHGLMTGTRFGDGGVNDRGQEIVVLHAGDDSGPETQVDLRNHGDSAPHLAGDLQAHRTEDAAPDESGLSGTDHEDVVITHEARESFRDSAGDLHHVAGHRFGPVAVSGIRIRPVDVYAHQRDACLGGVSLRPRLGIIHRMRITDSEDISFRHSVTLSRIGTRW